MTLLQVLLKTRYRSKRSEPSQPTDGFTMIELLVGAIVAFLIIGPLLGFVVSILNDDVKEQVKTATDYELQAAVDFISEDLSQAYYIYNPDQKQEDGPNINQIQAIRDKLPDEGEPILVFWKLHRLPDSVPRPGSGILPSQCDEPGNENECNDTSVRAIVSYHLVHDTNPIWCQPKIQQNPPVEECPKRIVRYLAHEQLEKFRGTGLYYEDSELDDFQKGELDIVRSGFDITESPIDNFPQEFKDAEQAVLVNYITDFSDPTSNPIEVSDTNDSVKFTIRANARRPRDGSQESTEFCDPGGDGEGTAECPTATVRVQGLPVEF